MGTRQVPFLRLPPRLLPTSQRKNRIFGSSLALRPSICRPHPDAEPLCLIAVILVGLVLYVRRLSMATLKRSFFTIIAVAIGVIVVLPFGIFDFVDSAISKRFLEDSNVSNNASERFSSLGHGFEVMFQYPFGIGYTARYNLMQAIGGWFASQRVSCYGIRQWTCLRRSAGERPYCTLRFAAVRSAFSPMRPLRWLQSICLKS